VAPERARADEHRAADARRALERQGGAWEQAAAAVCALAAAQGRAVDEEQLLLLDVHDLQGLAGRLRAAQRRSWWRHRLPPRLTSRGLKRGGGPRPTSTVARTRGVC
jgi:hypothetical protein